MKVQVLGGHGGQAKGYSTTSFLVDDFLLIDAGAVTGALSVEEQLKIDHILISHSHLDHIKDLAFLSDNCFGLRSKPFEVYTHETVNRIIKTHLLNDIVWPDFTVLPSKENPTIRINSIEEEKTLFLGEHSITPVKVHHAQDALGFIVERENSSILFTLDTGPTERIWEVAKRFRNLKAIFTEVSFPNRLSQVAEASEHHTPSSLKVELPKMPPEIPVILTHLKPNYRNEIKEEIKEIGESRVRILERDGESFSF